MTEPNIPLLRKAVEWVEAEAQKPLPKRPITVRRVKNAIEKAVREKGREYVYERQPDVTLSPDERELDGGSCQYAIYDENNKPVAPSCIVGHVLYYLGVPLSLFRGYEGSNINGLGTLLDEYDVPAEVRQPLQDAQSAQDEGNTWGDALDAFYRELERQRGAA